MLTDTITHYLTVPAWSKAMSVTPISIKPGQTVTIQITVEDAQPQPSPVEKALPLPQVAAITTHHRSGNGQSFSPPQEDELPPLNELTEDQLIALLEKRRTAREEQVPQQQPADPIPEIAPLATQMADNSATVNVDNEFANWLMQVWAEVSGRGQPPYEIVIVGTNTTPIAMSLVEMMRGHGRIVCAGDCFDQNGNLNANHVAIAGDDFKQNIFFGKPQAHDDGTLGDPVVEMPWVYEKPIDLLVFTVAGHGSYIKTALQAWSGKMAPHGIIVGNSYDPDAYPASIAVLTECFKDNFYIDGTKWFRDYARAPQTEDAVEEVVKKPKVHTRPSPGQPVSSVFSPAPDLVQNQHGGQQPMPKQQRQGFQGF